MTKRNRIKDAKLVAQFRSDNNTEALNELVRRWHKRFCKKAFWLVKDADLAKDIAQDTWSTIINKIDTLKDNSSFDSWALRIVYSKSLDELRKNTKERNKKEVYKYEQAVITVDHIDSNELEKVLLIKIKELPEHQQTVIRLFYTEDYSLKQISELLNIRIGTAKSRLFHAREKLKAAIKTKKENY